MLASFVARLRPRSEVTIDARRLVAIGRVLDEVRASCDSSARRAQDPVDFVHRYAAREDREIVALLAASFAFGNVKALSAKIAEVLALLGEHPAEAAGDARALSRRLTGFRHRVYRDGDVVGLLLGARRLQQKYGSLEAAVVDGLAKNDDVLEAALASFCHELRDLGGLSQRTNAGAKHILASPAGGSASKRLMLFLRWMIRPADGIDLGLWKLPPSLLVIPVDTHIHKLSKNLGLVSTTTVSWRAAREITETLARLDPSDPVKFDFSLCHMNMVQSCPSKRDPVKCASCGVKPVCRHWASELRSTKSSARPKA